MEYHKFRLRKVLDENLNLILDKKNSGLSFRFYKLPYIENPFKSLKHSKFVRNTKALMFDNMGTARCKTLYKAGTMDVSALWEGRDWLVYNKWRDWRYFWKDASVYMTLHYYCITMSHTFLYYWAGMMLTFRMWRLITINFRTNRCTLLAKLYQS